MSLVTKTGKLTERGEFYCQGMLKMCPHYGAIFHLEITFQRVTVLEVASTTLSKVKFS